MNPLGMSEDQIAKAFDSFKVTDREWTEAEQFAMRHMGARNEIEPMQYWFGAIRFAETHHSQALRELVEAAKKLQYEWRDANTKCDTTSYLGAEDIVGMLFSVQSVVNALAALNSPTPTSKEEE